MSTSVEDEYLSGRASMNCAQATEAEVDDEVKKLIASCYEEAKQIIRDNRDVMDQLARYLYDHETITGKEFMKIFREAKGLPEPVDTSSFSTSEKVAESVTFNEDGSYSSTLNGPTESDIWKGIGDTSSNSASSGADNTLLGSSEYGTQADTSSTAYGMPEADKQENADNKDTVQNSAEEEKPGIFNNSNNE